MGSRLTALSFSLAYFSLGASAFGQSGETLILVNDGKVVLDRLNFALD